MNKNDSSTQDEPKPVQETTQADEQKPDHKAEVSAPLPVVNPSDARAEEPKPDDSYDEADRKQDKTLQSIAEQTEWEAKQTEWMAKQTKWIRLQAIFSILLGAFTLIVLVFHGWIMSKQLKSTEQSIAAAVETFKIGERAYLYVKKITIDKLKVGSAPSITFTVINTGRLPASLIYIQGNMFLGQAPPHVNWDDSEPFIRQPPRKTVSDLISLEPSDQFNEFPILPTGETWTTNWCCVKYVFTEERLSKVYSGAEGFFFLLGIEYKDGVGHFRTLHHCFRFDPKSEELVACGGGE